MKLPGYYSSGEFAHKAHITKKTLRYYDEHNIFKPSYVTDKGARFYNDNDFAKLQQIQFFKYLGLSGFLINEHLNRAIVCWNWGAEMHLYGRGMLSAYRQIWIYC